MTTNCLTINLPIIVSINGLIYKMAYGVDLSDTFGSVWNVSTTTGWIAMTFDTHIRGAWGMSPTDFGDPLTFLASSLSQNVNVSNKYIFIIC